MKKYKAILLHTLFWSFYIYSNHIFTIIQQDPGYRTPFYLTFSRHFMALFIFYVTAYSIYPLCLDKKNNWKYLIPAMIFLTLVNFCLRYFVLGHFLPYVVGTRVSQGTLQEYYIMSLKWWFDYSLYGLGFWYAKKLIKTQRLLRETEKARLEAEFNHLRTQINPHFLFNTLNTFYSQSLDTLPDTAKGISLLSKIMRYSLEPPGTDGKVPLDDELAHANDYIELMKIRFPDKLQVHNNLPQESQHGWQILPHLLITLVENAFKHGNKDQPFIFDLQLNKEKKQVIFRVENTIAQRPADPGTGVGLRNVRERLQYAYGKAYTFKEEVIDNKYITLMIIPDSYIAPAAEINRQNDPGFNFQFS